MADVQDFAAFYAATTRHCRRSGHRERRPYASGCGAAARVIAVGAAAWGALVSILFTLPLNGGGPPPAETSSPSITAATPTPSRTTSTAASPSPSSPTAATSTTVAVNNPDAAGPTCMGNGYVFNFGDDVWTATLYPAFDPRNICPGEVRPFF